MCLKDIAIKGVDSDNWVFLVKLCKYHGISVAKLIDMICDNIASKPERDHLMDAIQGNRESELGEILRGKFN